MAAETDYRLDIYAPAALATDPDALVAAEYFRGPAGLDGIETVLSTAQRLLADVEGPADRYAEIYEHTGHGSGAFYDLIELPDGGAR